MAPKKIFPRWTMGMWEPMWKDYVKVTEQFIRAEGLKESKLKITVNEAPLKFDPKRFPGIPVPHIHLGNKMYALNDQQWKTFTTQLNKEMAIKLNAVKPVDIAEIANISNAISAVGVKTR
ncbi:hypothetical protein EPN18_04130 [bacterium]|nr:MAG: hypothetical protein EPN18_04130 [bacterium]